VSQATLLQDYDAYLQRCVEPLAALAKGFPAEVCVHEIHACWHDSGRHADEHISSVRIEDVVGNNDAIATVVAS
jgi:hypothetical protein